MRRPDQAFKPFHPAGPLPYPPAIAFPSGFLKPRLPSKVSRPPSGSLWVHEIKHDGYRLMVRRDGLRVCFTRGGHNWGDRFRLSLTPRSASRCKSFLIDGEVVITGDERPALSLLDLDQRWHASRFEDRNSRVPSLM